MTPVNEAAPAQMLHLDEAVPLLHGVVDEVARALGIRIMFIKGPILTAQGLRGLHHSVDVDVLVDPGRLADLQRGLEELGWAVRVPSTSPRVLPQHSTTYAHPVWPCEIDVHDRFPGFLTHPMTAFEALWVHRATTTLAGREVPCPQPVAHFAVACLHALRDSCSSEKRAELARLIGVGQESLDTKERSALGVLAARTGSLDTLRPVLDGLGILELTSATSADDLVHWRIVTRSQDVRSVGWLMELGRTPLRRLPATLLHAVLLNEAEVRDAQPDAARGAWGLLRARLRRLARGLRDIPRAGRIIWRARRERRTT